MIFGNTTIRPIEVSAVRRFGRLKFRHSDVASLTLRVRSSANVCEISERRDTKGQSIGEEPRYGRREALRRSPRVRSGGGSSRLESIQRYKSSIARVYRQMHARYRSIEHSHERLFPFTIISLSRRCSGAVFYYYRSSVRPMAARLMDRVLEIVSSDKTGYCFSTGFNRRP